MKGVAVSAVAGLLALAAGVPAQAQPVSRQELLDALHERDRVIETLQKRIQALETGRRAPSPRPAKPVTAGPAPAPAATPPPTAPTVQAERMPPTPPSAPPSPPEKTRNAEDDVALQALSRTLVQRGALLLPEWGFEVSPSLAYEHTLTEGLVVAPTPEGVSTVINQRLREDAIKAALALRLGLPWESQIEVRVPYTWTRQSVTLGDGSSLDRSAPGVGDVEVELSRQLLRERSGWPDLLAGLSWRFPTGRDPFRLETPGLAAGTGTQAVKGRLTASKSSDPLVFFGTLSYTANLTAQEPVGRIHPGNTLGLEFGTILAVSPETSLTFSLSQDFIAKTRVEGTALPGSDRVSSVLQIGADTVLGSNLLLDLTVGVGLTRDAPDYQVLLSLPMRF